MKLHIIVCLSVAPLVAQQALATETETTSEFCWRDSYGRGVGTVPNDCGDRDKIGLLCYSKCPQGMKRIGFDCHSVCPDDFRDDGLFCRKTEYGRGAGYPWKFGDGLNDKGMFKRCEKDHGKGNCEKSGLVVYPKCKPGYSAFGCCICRPSTPNCNSLNLNNGIDLSCAKRIRIGDPITGNCGAGKEKNAGLCYEACKNNYKGVGPVCWGQAPKDWVECGMGAATSKKTCADATISQVSSVGMLAFNIATLGTSKAATAPEKASRFAELKKLYDKLKDILDKKGLIKAYERASEVMAISGVLQSTVETATDDDVCAEDIARLGAEMASLIDPTGVADVVSAYTYPKCSKIGAKTRFSRRKHHKSRALRKGTHRRAQKALSS